jgi:fatty-acyl-CoA synthase
MEVPLLIDDFLQRSSMLYPEKTAVVDGDSRFSYRQLQARVNQMSNALLSLGVEQGDRVCILSPNSHFFLESFYATSQIGAILVPLNYRLIAADHEYIIDHAGVSVMLADYEQASLVDQFRAKLANVKHWIVAQDKLDIYAGWVDWNTLISNQSEIAPEPPQRSENDTVSINYTSGTTARPKGVMLTHRNCYINAYSMIAHLRVSHDDVELWTLPMFHCNGWGGVYFLTGMGGTHVILRAVEPQKIFELIENEKVTFACMAPTVLRMILDYENKHKHKIQSKPRFAVAGAPTPITFIERLENELEWEFIQIYGLTETAPLLTSSLPDFATKKEDYQRRSRAGSAAIGVDIKVVDSQDNPVPQDNVSVGEICTRSNVVFKGYWKQQEETDKAIYDGYFHTGDLAVWDEFGNINIVDRKKDVIISGGENISSPEIEDVLYTHHAVLECAVIGVPHSEWGETPKALVVLREGQSADEKELMDFCRENLAHFKCPTSIEQIDELPRTATGKLQKYRLREKYWDNHSKRVS